MIIGNYHLGNRNDLMWGIILVNRGLMTDFFSKKFYECTVTKFLKTEENLLGYDMLIFCLVDNN